MRKFFCGDQERPKSVPKLDFGSEISVERSSGGINNKESKMICITMKSKTESIDSLLKKIPGLI